MENENVPKQFKINQNILKMLSCKENAKKKNQKQKSIFWKTDFA